MSGSQFTHRCRSWCCWVASKSSILPFYVHFILGFLLSRQIHNDWSMVSSGMLHYVALVRTDVSEELSASFIRVTRISELGAMLAVTSNRQLQLALFLFHRFLSSWWRRLWVPPKRRFLQEPHGVTSQKTPFFIVTAMKTSNLTQIHNHCQYIYLTCEIVDYSGWTTVNW
jgi:hypothetical protein